MIQDFGEAPNQMATGISRLPAAFLAALLLALPAAAAAQDNASAGANSAAPVVVGPPVLRDFELEGTRTTPPAEPQPVRTVPTQVAEQPARTAPANQPPVRRGPAPSTPAGPVAAGPEPVVAGELPVFTDTVIEPAAPAPPPAALGPEPVAEAEPFPPGNAMWIALGVALLGLLGFVAWRRSRRSEELEPALARAAAPEHSAPTAQPVAAPAAAPAFDEALRPWIEVDFKPERMVATDTEATVQFELLVKNVGKSEARNVRIQARMFNASAEQKQEIGIFFATPIQPAGDAMVVPAQTGAKFRTSVAMPRGRVKEIQVQGRPIFVPTVAINIVYEYGDGRKGQTSSSYVIGTQTEASAEKMGPFRLDLGPRIYRQVGGRAIDLAKAI